MRSFPSAIFSLDHCQPLDIGKVLQIEFDILPERSQLPIMKLRHFKYQADLAMLLDQSFNFGNKFFIVLPRELSGSMNFQNSTFLAFLEFYGYRISPLR
jgi:hypothetical protein